MRIGIFELHNPEREREFRHALSLIDFPWWRCLPYLQDKGQQIDVFYDTNMAANFSGVWMSQETSYAGVGPYPAASLILNGNRHGDHFTLAHELGHATDTCCLVTWEHTLLTQLLHGQTKTGDFGHDSTVMQHNERGWWGSSTTEYPARLVEAHADAFVACFAPDIWGVRNVRFVHWPLDLDGYREAVLAREIAVYDDVTSRNVHKDNIEEAAVLGLLQGDGNKFKPRKKVTRDQYATGLVNVYHRAVEEAVARIKAGI